MNRYSIVTGYYAAPGDTFKQNFFAKWLRNTHRYAPNAVDIFVINAGCETPGYGYGIGGTEPKWIDLSHNLGHVHDMDARRNTTQRLGGWSMSFVLGALLCYANNTDFVYKEQDCLAFGDWVGKMYEELHGRQMLVGRAQDSEGQGLEQSLFIIRHEFILPFVTAYLGIEQCDGGVNYFRPELKFRYLCWRFGSAIGDLSFGYGRSRPKDWNDPVFYIQHVSPQEVESLIEAGRL